MIFVVELAQERPSSRSPSQFAPNGTEPGQAGYTADREISSKERGEIVETDTQEHGEESRGYDGQLMTVILLRPRSCAPRDDVGDFLVVYEVRFVFTRGVSFG